MEWAKRFRAEECVLILEDYLESIAANEGNIISAFSAFSLHSYNEAINYYRC